MNVEITRQRGRPKRSISQSLDERILAVAAKAFAEVGYCSVSVEMIAREAGVDRRTLYRRYGDKEGLFVASMLHQIQGLIRYESDLEEDGEAHQWGAIRTLCKRATDALLDPKSVQVCRAIYAEAHRHPALGDALSKWSVDYVLKPISDEIRLAQSRNEVRAGDAFILARQLLNACMAYQHLDAILGGYNQTVNTTGHSFEENWVYAKALLGPAV